MGRQKNLPADLSEFSSELQDGDRILGNDELSVLSVFANLEKRVGSDSNPGATVLRRCQPGRVLCRQADAGATAFYILTAGDVQLLQRMDAILSEVRELERQGSASSEAQTAQQARMAELQQQKAALLKEAEQAARLLKDEALDDTAAAIEPPQVAEARLLAPAQTARRRRGIWSRLLTHFSRRGQQSKTEAGFIPVDGPVDIDRGTMTAPLREGEVFGEMSCLRRVPRSATVVVTQECYVIEMLLVIFNKARADPVFKSRMDGIYRRRTLSTHLRQFSFFARLSDAEFDQIKDRLSLQTFQEGDVLFDEFDETSDCAYLIRSGLVQVRKGMHLLFGRSELQDAQWRAIATEIEAHRSDPGVCAALVLDAVPASVAETLRDVAGGNLQRANELRIALNEFIRDADLVPRIESEFKVKTVGDLLDALAIAHDPRQIPDATVKLADMSQVLWRVVRRLMLEELCPGLPRRANSLMRSRTLTYLGRGSHIGEMGVLRGDPRNATCIAFEDDSMIARSVTGNTVEVVRLDGETLRSLASSNPGVAAAINEVISGYERQQQVPEQSDLQRDFMSQELDELRIVEGQNLMLVDLDRCTRCGECISACVDSHDDGRTRLYLEGPRIGNYLVPMTCRECVDPYCMRNCPVSAIYRGPDGEMTITDWCIGCQKCAEDCPFGSIHMNPVGEALQKQVGEDSEFKTVTQQATVCDLCTTTPSKDPACVYACPHDAAIRVNGREFYDTFR